MGLAVTTKTLQNIFDRVTRQFGDESGSQITLADITAWTNSAITEVVRKNRILKAKSTTPSVAGQKDYTFSGLNILNIEHLHYAGVPLRYMGFQEAQEYIAKYDPTQIQSDTPTLFYEWASVISLYPVPQLSGDDIDIYYVQYPAAISIVTDLLGVPDQYFDAILQYVLAQAYEQDDDWQGSAIKAQQSDASLNQLAQDPQTYVRGTYHTIMVMEEDM
jgi:hypothetical protein